MLRSFVTSPYRLLDSNILIAHSLIWGIHFTAPEAEIDLETGEIFSGQRRVRAELYYSK